MFSSIREKNSSAHCFEHVAQYFSHKSGLCIFEMNQQWRSVAGGTKKRHQPKFPTIILPDRCTTFLSVEDGLAGFSMMALLFSGNQWGHHVPIPTQKYTVVGEEDFFKEALHGLKRQQSFIFERKSVIIPPPTEKDRLWFCTQINTLKRPFTMAWSIKQTFHVAQRLCDTNPFATLSLSSAKQSSSIWCISQFANTQVISNSPELFVHSTK